IFALICAHLQQAPLAPGWQSTMNIKERATHILQMVTGLRMLQPNETVERCIELAESFERKAIQESGSKRQAKNQEISRRRQVLANSMMQGNSNMQNLQLNAAAGTAVPMNRLNPGQGNQGQGFPPHLQQQMQVSNIGMPPQLDASGAMNGPNMQSMAALNQQQQQQQQQRPSMHPGMVQQQQQAPPNAQQQQHVMQRVQTMYNNMSDDEKNRHRQQYMSKLTQQQRENLQHNPGDPLLYIMRQQLMAKMRASQAQGAQ
ncbi:hypothetical protein LTR28_002495, partial [Elasticomyces elasticus]